MYPKVIESYGQYGVNVGKMVRRMLRYVPPESIQGLNTIRILDRAPNDRGFACYFV